MTTPKADDDRTLLFMGEVLESGFRGRIYDGTREPTEDEVRMLRDWRERRESEPRMHGPVSASAGTWLTHRGTIRRCECGECIFGPCRALASEVGR